MGKRWKEIKDLFSKFWCNNIKTHYKAISIAIGTALNGIFSSVVGYAIAISIKTGDPTLAGLIIGIIVPIQGLANALCFYTFGKQVNGNGYKVPETKQMVDLVKKDEEVRRYMKEKILEYINKDSQLLNNFKKKEDEK